MEWNMEEALIYYGRQGAPGDQNALVQLLREIQQVHGGQIPQPLLSAVAHAYRIRESFLLAVIRRFPGLRLSNTHCLELCAGPNCGKHAHLAALAEELLKANPGSFTLRFTPCMRMCGKGPNLRWDGELYHKADEALLRKLTKQH